MALVPVAAGELIPAGLVTAETAANALRAMLIARQIYVTGKRFRHLVRQVRNMIGMGTKPKKAVNRVVTQTVLQHVRSPRSVRVVGTSYGKRPRVRQRDATITLKHTEELATIAGSASFAGQTIAVNPLNSSFSGWLANLAPLFGYYRINSAQLVYKPNVGDDIAGRVGMAFVPDVDTQLPTSFPAMKNVENANWDVCHKTIKLPLDLSLVNKKAPFLVHESAETQLSTMGIVMVAVDSATAAQLPATFGHVDIEYSITFETTVDYEPGMYGYGSINASTGMTKSGDAVDWGSSVVVIGDYAVEGTNITFPRKGRFICSADFSIGNTVTAFGQAGPTVVSGAASGIGSSYPVVTGAVTNITKTVFWFDITIDEPGTVIQIDMFNYTGWLNVLQGNLKISRATDTSLVAEVRNSHPKPGLTQARLAANDLDRRIQAEVDRRTLALEHRREEAAFELRVSRMLVDTQHPTSSLVRALEDDDAKSTSSGWIRMGPR